MSIAQKLLAQGREEGRREVRLEGGVIQTLEGVLSRPITPAAVLAQKTSQELKAIEERLFRECDARLNGG